MFCGECGTKNEQKSAFCENCGAKLNEVKVDNNSKPKTKKEKDVKSVEKVIEQPIVEPTTSIKENQIKQNNKKGNKKIFITLIIIVAILGSAYYYVDKFIFTPEIVVEDFLESLKDGDTSMLSEYLEFEESEFVSKDKLNNEDAEKVDIDYDIKKVKIDGDEAEIDVELKSEDEELDVEFVLEAKDKKYLIFKDWKITEDTIKELFGDDAFTVIKDFEISVISGSVVKIDGKTLDSKYLNEDESTTEVDVYIIPEMLSVDYELEITLPNDMVLENTIKPSTYNYNYDLDYITIDDLTQKDIDKLEEDIIEEMEKLYNYAIEGKNFEEIKDEYELENLDLDDFEDVYDEFLEAVVSYSYTLKEIDITELELTYISFEDDYIDASFDIEYDFTIDYESFDGTITEKSDSDDSYINVDVKFIDGKYFIQNSSYLVSYFYIY